MVLIGKKPQKTKIIHNNAITIIEEPHTIVEQK